MGLLIEEVETYSGATAFLKKYTDSNQNIISERLICFKSEKYIDKGGSVFFLIYDSKYRVVTEGYQFINFEKKYQSPNTKEMYSAALKLIFSFCELFNINLESFNKQNVRTLIDFLYGLSQLGHIELRLNTRRSPETINNYLSTYRSFFNFIGYDDSVFHEKVHSGIEKGTQGLLAHAKKEQKTRYKVNLKTEKPIVVPKYIDIKQFKKIIKYVRANYSYREEIIIRLMFETGMRIGEVLGLTLEDIVTNPEEFSYKDLDEVGRINIVNRLSDKPYQMAKTYFIPKQKEDYLTDFYEEKSVQFVTPTISLLIMIEKYIEETHGALSEKNRENYLASAADFIDENNNYLEKGNFYIFLNKNGEPLSKSGWNKILRTIFLSVGLTIDNNIRKHNLSHRFRHGYAMYLVKYKKYTELELKVALRHKSITSVQVYFNPTESDRYEANKNASEVLYNLFPELLEDF